MTEQAMDKMKEKIAIHLSQQETAIANLLNPAQFLRHNYTYDLCKLPMVGAQVSADQIDFEWPTQEIWQSMANHENIKLKKIDICGNNDGNRGYFNITKLKVTLSNWQESLQYQSKSKGWTTIDREMNSDANTQIKSYEFAIYDKT